MRKLSVTLNVNGRVEENDFKKLFSESHNKMRRFYLVRHAPKAWKNGRKQADVTGHQHDPPLIDESTSPELVKTIEQLQGVEFDGIYCSPFLRTRQTLGIVLSSLNKKEASTVIDAGLGEYLGNHRRGNLDLQQDTLCHYPRSNLLLSESIKRVELRVKKFLASLPPEGTFLIVSHGLVLSKICGQDIEEGALLQYTTE